MLTFEQIKSAFPAGVYGRNPKAVLVEYLQYELLDSLFKQKGSENLSFIGGTAIRIIYGSTRFSEDLDFDNFGLSFKDFGELIKYIIFDMEKKGFELEFRLVEKGAYHCYIKFPELLANNNFSAHKDEKILVRIDAVKKEKLYSPRIVLLNAFDVYRRIIANPPEIILSQKLITILERKRAKGRDFYDVSFLLGVCRPDFFYIEKIRGIKRSELKEKLIKKTETLNLDDLAKDVEPFLFDYHDRERILSFREYIEQAL